MPVQGRPKGSKAEIEVAKLLKGWWDPDGPSEFVRTPLSGGWGGKEVRAGFRASGDIMTTSPSFPFTVEVKRREGWSWETLKKGKKSPIWGYWRQAVGQAKEMGGTPLMFFRKNREPWHVMLPTREFCRVKAGCAPEDIVCTWYGFDLRRNGVAFDVLPAVVRADWLLETEPADWMVVAPTFPRP